MSTVPTIDQDNADGQTLDVFNDIKKTRNTEYINNFWRSLSHDPKLLTETWSQLKETMRDNGEIPRLMKELIYIAVSTANNCNYCIHSHTATARALGMTEQMYNELLEIILLANKTNAMATALGVEVDNVYLK